MASVDEPESLFVTHNLLELAASYSEYSVLLTTAELDLPGPQILYVNSAFTRMTGYAVSELLGKTPRILQGEQTDRSTLNQIRRTLESGKDFVGRAINYRQDGTPFQLEWIISHLRDNEGKTTHYIAVQRDITGQQRAERDLKKFDEEMKQACRELKETAQRLELAEANLLKKDRFAVIGEMAAGVIHDISNALTPVFGLVQVLHGLENLPEEARKFTNDLDTSIEHAMDVLTNLKTYYADGSSKPRNSLALQTLLQRIPDITRAKWWSQSRQSQSAVNFAFDLRAAGRVVANETELLQVFVNIVLNSIEAMPTGGTVTLALIEDSGFAEIKIEDTGTGMSPELIRACFEPYMSTRSTGTGLGLSVCKRIIEQHHGTIAMSAVVPQGVCCTIRLPLEATPGSDSVSSSQSLRVLHVSSSETERADVAQLLDSLGLIAISANSGDDGLEKFFQAPTDLVIAGCALPAVAKYDLTHMIKRKANDVPVLTCQEEAESADEWPDQLRPDSFLSAPITRHALVSTLLRLGLLSE